MNKIIYVEAPTEIPHGCLGKYPRIFLAGGITGCPDWQANFVAQMKEWIAMIPENTHIIILNPRRAIFPNDIEAVKQQITWEYRMLREANIVSFYFAEKQLQPIVMYELGATLQRYILDYKHEFRASIGIHPDYPRKFDVEYQTASIPMNHRINVSQSLDDLISDVFKLALEYLDIHEHNNEPLEFEPA
jgi:hypothetical protein